MLADGMRMDLQKSRYQNFDELYEYCYKVAGTVGMDHNCILMLSDQAPSHKTSI